MFHSKLQGKTVFLYFTLFFGLIAAVNSAFVYTALQTHSGTVTENAYEKGLAYNETLAAFKNQPKLKEKAVLDKDVFRWQIQNKDGSPVTNANATVTFFRPVAQGSDFSLTLAETSPGVYESQPDFPAKGVWTAQLDAVWDHKQYRTSQTIIAK